jgi:hypothetical protein
VADRRDETDRLIHACERSASRRILLSTSGMGQKQTCRFETAMSALPPKADMAKRDRDVRFVPIADMFTLSLDHLVGTL